MVQRPYPDVILSNQITIQTSQATRATISTFIFQAARDHKVGQVSASSAASAAKMGRSSDLFSAARLPTVGTAAGAIPSVSATFEIRSTPMFKMGSTPIFEIRFTPIFEIRSTPRSTTFRIRRQRHPVDLDLGP